MWILHVGMGHGPWAIKIGAFPGWDIQFAAKVLVPLYRSSLDVARHKERNNNIMCLPKGLTSLVWKRWQSVDGLRRYCSGESSTVECVVIGAGGSRHCHPPYIHPLSLRVLCV